MDDDDVLAYTQALAVKVNFQCKSLMRQQKWARHDEKKESRRKSEGKGVAPERVGRREFDSSERTQGAFLTSKFSGGRVQSTSVYYYSLELQRHGKRRRTAP